jgi:hypothetical protein
METDNNKLVTYSPAAVLNLFNDTLSVNKAKRLIQLKGIYVLGKARSTAVIITILSGTNPQMPLSRSWYLQ